MRPLIARSAALTLLGIAVLSPLGIAAERAEAQATAAPRCAPSTLNISAALAGSRVTVSPEPGSLDASAATQISFLGVPAAELSGVAVSGSRSGLHAGRLIAYSQGDGASFLPEKPFVDGELVSVHAELHEGASTVPFSWSFTIATRDTANATGGSGVPRPNPSEYQSFRSRPDLRPPTVTVTTRSAALAPGDLFLAPYSGSGQYGPMILDPNGNLVWFKALPRGTRAADFRVQEYEGQPVLTWWQDPIVIDGERASAIVITNSAYQDIATVRAGNDYQADLHEFQITPQGTALITIYSAIDCDLASVGGPREGAVADTLMQEIDLKTGLVMYEWHSLDHVPLKASYASAGPTSERSPFDFFHINAINVEKDGDFLIDSRNTWAAYDVSPLTGQVRWQLGGKQSSFKMGAGTETAWQHDAREQADGTISFFDNGASPAAHPQSRAIDVRLDMQSMTATLVRRFEHPTPLLAGSQGDAQSLPNGDWLVGWGQVPDFSEFSTSGALLFDAHLPSDYESYRTYRFPWIGQPTSPPSVRVLPAPAGRLSVYASWNGATQVAAWRVLEGATPTTLAAVGQVTPRTGFETTIAVPAVGGYVAVQALDASGAVLGSSAVGKA